MSIHTKESVRGTILSHRYAWPVFQAAASSEMTDEDGQVWRTDSLTGYTWLSSRVHSGMNVNAETAMRVTAVYACVKIISEDIAKLPLKLYKWMDDGKSKTPDPTHPLYSLLYHLPNRWQTAFEFRSMMQGHLLLRGNAYARIMRDASGTVRELLPLHPDRVRLFLATDGSVFYEVRDRDGRLPKGPLVPQDEIFHLRGLCQDGYVGISPISACAEAIGLAMAAQIHDATLLAKGATLPGAVKLEKNNPTETDLQTARDTWQAIHGGALNAGKAAMFSGGMSWLNVGISPKDLQIMELRAFQVPEVLRIFRVPQHKAGELSRSTNNNIEQQAREHVDDCLYPQAICWEQAIVRDLLLPEERATHFPKFNFDALLRADTLSRYRAHQLACGRPWATGNEVRDVEDLNRSTDPSMDEIALPLNIAESAEAGAAADKQIDENNRPAPPPANGKGSLPAGAAQ
jgi:HK97 family phage portal protein